MPHDLERKPASKTADSATENTGSEADQDSIRKTAAMQARTAAQGPQALSFFQAAAAVFPEALSTLASIPGPTAVGISAAETGSQGVQGLYHKLAGHDEKAGEHFENMGFAALGITGLGAGAGKLAKGLMRAGKTADAATAVKTAKAAQANVATAESIVDPKRSAASLSDDALETAGSIQKNIFHGHLPKGVQWAGLTDEAGNLIDGTKEGVALAIKDYGDYSIAINKFAQDEIRQAPALAASVAPTKSKSQAISALRDRAAGPHGHPDETVMLGDGTGLHVYREPPYQLFVAIKPSEAAEALPSKHAWAPTKGKSSHAEKLQKFDHTAFHRGGDFADEAAIPALFSSEKLPPDVTWAALGNGGTFQMVAGNLSEEHHLLVTSMGQAILNANEEFAARTLSSEVSKTVSKGNPLPALQQKVAKGSYDIAFRLADGTALHLYRHSDVELIVAVRGAAATAA